MKSLGEMTVGHTSSARRDVFGSAPQRAGLPLHWPISGPNLRLAWTVLLPPEWGGKDLAGDEAERSPRSRSIPAGAPKGRKESLAPLRGFGRWRLHSGGFARPSGFASPPAKSLLALRAAKQEHKRMAQAASMSGVFPLVDSSLQGVPNGHCAGQDWAHAY